MNPLRKKYRAAVRYFYKGKFEKCLEMLNDYLKDVDFNYLALYYKARCLSVLKENDQALSIFEDLLDIHIDKEVVLMQIGYIHYLNSHLDKAKHAFEQIVKINQYNIRGNYYLGIINYDLKNYENAIGYFNNALDFENDIYNSDGYNVYLDRAKAYYENKDFEKAMKDLNEAKEIEPDNYFIYY